MQYPGVFRPAENVLFPAHEGRLGDGGVIGRHGDPDLMAEFAEEYLTQGWAIMPKGRLPRTVSEMMPALNLLVNGVELALKAYLVRGHKRSGGHNLRALYGRLDQDHRREIEGRFAAAAPNANLKALGAKGCTVESTLAVYGTSFGSTVYMDTRYFAEPTEMLDRKSLKGGNLVKTAPYPIFLPHLVQALLGTYAFFSGAERLKRRGADVHRFSRAPKDTHGDWGLTPSSLGLIVIQVAQRVATDDSGAGREAFRKFKTARPPGYCASWMYGGKRLLFYRAGKEHPEDGETVVDGLECRVWCSGRLGMHARDLYLLADALDAPGGLDRFEWE